MTDSPNPNVTEEIAASNQYNIRLAVDAKRPPLSPLSLNEGRTSSSRIDPARPENGSVIDSQLLALPQISEHQVEKMPPRQTAGETNQEPDGILPKLETNISSRDACISKQDLFHLQSNSLYSCLRHYGHTLKLLLEKWELEVEKPKSLQSTQILRKRKLLEESEEQQNRLKNKQRKSILTIYRKAKDQSGKVNGRKRRRHH